MLATGQAPTCLPKTVRSSWKGRMETERCVQKGDADIADLMKGNTGAAVTCTMMAHCYGIGITSFPLSSAARRARGCLRNRVFCSATSLLPG